MPLTGAADNAGFEIRVYGGRPVTAAVRRLQRFAGSRRQPKISAA